MKGRIVIATPYRRYDILEKGLKETLCDYQILRIREKDELSEGRMELLSPRYIFFPHWSWKIPEKIFNRFECVIFHMTDLPYGRGGSPLQNLIIRGHTETKLSAIRCEIGLDSGPVYEKRTLSLEGTADEILLRASKIMEEMIVSIVQNHPEPVKQTGEPVMFSRRKPEDGDLTKVDSISTAYDYIRMLDGEGYPPAFIQTDTLRFEFSKAKYNGSTLTATVVIRNIKNE